MSGVDAIGDVSSEAEVCGADTSGMHVDGACETETDTCWFEVEISEIEGTVSDGAEVETDTIETGVAHCGGVEDDGAAEVD